MATVEVHNLTKTYGELTAVDDISFTAQKGELLALVGPDGAGKTTLFRSLCNLIDFDRGDINMAGYNLSKEFDKIKDHLGYMPQTFSLYPDLSVEENLKFYAGLFGLSGKQFNDKKDRLYSFSGLEPFAQRRAAALSGGMKQKLALSCNLIHDPDILLLDEPTTGVDPLSRRQFWDILKGLRDEGSCIVVSTPYMDEVALSDRSIFIHKGKKLSEGTPDELMDMFKGNVYEADVFPSADAMDRLNNIEGITSRRFGSKVHLYTPENRAIDNFREELNRLQISESNIREIEPDLEDVFIQQMGK